MVGIAVKTASRLERALCARSGQRTDFGWSRIDFVAYISDDRVSHQFAGNQLLARLKTLGLIRIATVYIVGGWIVIQVADIGLDTFEAPTIFMRFVMGLILLGFPIVLGILWLMGVRLNKVVTTALQTPKVPEKGGRPSIILLPFKHLGGGDEFTAEGLRMGLQTNMVRLSGLFQMYAADSESYRNGEMSGLEKGRSVNARYVLEGSVQQQAERLRISLQLTDVETGQCTWGEQYDRNLEDLFELQDDIIHEVISSLHIELRASDLGEDWFGQLRCARAKELYFRGQNFLAQQSPGGMASARAAFEELYELEPTAPIGPSNIILSHWNDYATGWTGEPKASLREAYQWMQIARSLEPNDGLAEAVYAHQQLHERNFDEALAAAKRSAKMRPNCPISLSVLAQVENYSGESSLAREHASDAISRLDVAAPAMANTLAAIQRDCGDYAKSIATTNTVLAMDPGNLDALVIQCCDYALKDDIKRAKTVAEQVRCRDANWSSKRYSVEQPYRNATTLDQQVQGLNRAGLE